MTPKRKFIKKQFIAPQSQTNQQTLHPSINGDIIQQIKSQDSKIKIDAVTALANIQDFNNDIQQQVYSTSTFMELIKILLTSTNTSLTQTTLFAINNLCVNYTENNGIGKIVRLLFTCGLDKALLQLDSTNTYLIKPILVLMANISNYIPNQYKYLLIGIQNTLISNADKYLKQQKYYDLVIQFLMKTNYTVNLQQITNNQQKCLELLRVISQLDKLYKNRAIAATTLLTMTKGKNKQCIQIFCNNFQQFITDIDLQKQYVTNFAHKQQQTNQLDEEQIAEQHQQKQQKQVQKNMMEEQSKGKSKKSKKQKNKDKNKQSQQIQHTNINPNKAEAQSSYMIFIDALEGLQTMFQFIVQQFQDQLNFDEQEDEDQQQMGEQEGNNQQQKIQQTFNREIFFVYIQKSLVKVIKLFQKLANLTFIEGQNLIQLALRLLLAMPNNFCSKNQEADKINIQNLIILTQAILIHQFKLELKEKRIPQQILIFNTTTALQIILKYKQILHRGLYVDLPHLKYENTQNALMKINGSWKQTWLNLLQIYSLFYNPQKVIAVSEDENRKIGGILKKLIVEIPQIQLQQWRGEAIDTLFDIYSNQKYDKIFVQFGFMEILGQVLKVSGGNNKMGAKGKKRNKFISDILTDIQRFVAYKKNNIGL